MPRPELSEELLDMACAFYAGEQAAASGRPCQAPRIISDPTCVWAWELGWREYLDIMVHRTLEET